MPIFRKSSKYKHFLKNLDKILHFFDVFTYTIWRITDTSMLSTTCFFRPFFLVLENSTCLAKCRKQRISRNFSDVLNISSRHAPFQGTYPHSKSALPDIPVPAKSRDPAAGWSVYRKCRSYDLRHIG